MNTRDKIKEKCKQVEELLLEKNQAYGNSALIPANIFSNLSSIEAIKIRIDDKLKRIENKGINDETEDTVMDLAGYLILLMIAKDNESNYIQKYKGNKKSASYNDTDCTSTHTGGQIKVTYQED
tara:strand:- start:1891 stop:2262 length:372 start_codon:yes stop_codon:yes gene_type:complete